MPPTIRLTLLTLLALPFTTLAADFYVSPTGDDTHPGTKDQPFATLARAQSAASPGDTVLLRGGTYKITESQIAKKERIFAHVILLDKSGLPDKPITYTNAPGETPSFDFSAVKPENHRVHAFSVAASHLVLRGIDVTGVQVTIKTHTQSICFSNDGSHNRFERLTMHDGHAIGYYSTRGKGNLVLNCDAWNNYDPVSENGKGGNVDGFGAHPRKGDTGNVFRGCRAWFNSDDGYDCINAHEPVVFENCWAFYNGFTPDFTKRADGNGFKAGGYGSTPPDRLPNSIPRHVVRGCLAVYNKASGVYANHHPGGVDFLHNTAYRNASADFNLLSRLMDNRTDVDGTGHTLHHNLAYKGRTPVARIVPEKCDLKDNSWMMPHQITDADFESTDESLLTRPRNEDGSLPSIPFLRPVPTSPIAKLGAFPTP